MSIEPHIGKFSAIGHNRLTSPFYILNIFHIQIIILEPIATFMPANRLTLTNGIEDHSTNTPTLSYKILETSRANIRIHFLGLLSIASVAKKCTRLRASVTNWTRHDQTTLAKFIVTVCNFHFLSPVCHHSIL